MAEDTPGRSPNPLKAVAGIALVVIAVAAVAVGLVREAGRASEASNAGEPARTADAVTVYYFHSDTRCETCLSIESQTAQAVEDRFGPELATGQLRFEVVNFDTPADRHYQDDFDLAFGSVVVCGAGETPEWENLADVWTLIHDDPAAFEAYLVEHIRPMLDAPG